MKDELCGVVGEIWSMKGRRGSVRWGVVGGAWSMGRGRWGVVGGGLPVGRGQRDMLGWVWSMKCGDRCAVNYDG